VIDVIDVSEAKTDQSDDEEEIENNLDEINANKTFHNPSQEDKSPSEDVFTCEKCDFKAATKTDLVKHKKEVHYWCELCFSSFNSRKRIKNHIIKNHKKQ
jgi:hypothetical protein